LPTAQFCLASAAAAAAAATAGTATEMVTPGGELSFVRAMIADSLVLRGRVHWYTSMCGKKNTLKILRQELHNAGGETLGLHWNHILIFLA
jgi:23S rRNA (adenine1618-N6)-methyltransferase